MHNLKKTNAERNETFDILSNPSKNLIVPVELTNQQGRKNSLVLHRIFQYRYTVFFCLSVTSIPDTL